MFTPETLAAWIEDMFFELADAQIERRMTALVAMRADAIACPTGSDCGVLLGDAGYYHCPICHTADDGYCVEA